jgi:hypothetical protein
MLERGLGTTGHPAGAAPIAMFGIPLLTVIRCSLTIVMDGNARPLAGRGLRHLPLPILSLRQSGDGGRRLIREIDELWCVAPSRQWKQSGSRRRHVGGEPWIWVSSRPGDIKEEKRKAADYGQDSTDNPEHGQRQLIALGFQPLDHVSKRGTTY